MTAYYVQEENALRNHEYTWKHTSFRGARAVYLCSSTTSNRHIYCHNHNSLDRQPSTWR
jgi:hypothetical protein